MVSGEIGPCGSRLEPDRIRPIVVRVLLWLIPVLVLGWRSGEACAQGVAGTVEIEAEQFGVGNAVRPGSWAGVRLRLTDRGDRARDVVVRFGVRDPDGDLLLAQRTATVSPRGGQNVWLYAPLPWGTNSGSAFSVTVEEIAGGGEGGEGGQARIAGTIGRGRVGPRAVAGDSDALIGVVGSMPAGGLPAYSVTPDGLEEPLTAHELTRVLSGLNARDMPDRWMGLAMFEALVWVEGNPGELNTSQADAVEEWVRRGGRLVVALPSVGQAWEDARANPLASVLPRVRVARREGFDLERARALLRPRDRVPLPSGRTVHFFSVADGSTPAEASPILAIGEGIVAVRRTLDAGSVTLVGFDLSDPALAAAVDAQAFWHRLLGKRFDVLTRDEIRKLAESKQVMFFSRSREWLDEHFGAEIAKSGSASVGVLLALIVFAAYLLLAGPGSFALLRARGAAQWSWVVFAGIAGVFTAIAWGGATMTRPLKTEIRHLTLLDHVYGQGQQSARSWMSILLPTYGDQRVEIDRASSESGVHNALAPWQAPGVIASAGFPDTRPYVMDSRDPSELTAPARATVKQLRADWLGGPAWKMPSPPADATLRLSQAGGRQIVTGSLRHELPSALRDVVIVVVRGQTPLGAVPGAGGKLQTYASAWRLVSAWEPGVTIDLEQALAPSSAEAAENYLESLAKDAAPGAFGGLSPGDPGLLRRSARRLEALAWRSMLEQPDYLNRGTDQRFSLLARDAQAPDLGVWFTQPSVIIVGRLDDAPLPIPVRVDGKVPPSEGRVVIRWVYPLEPAPAAMLGE